MRGNPRGEWLALHAGTRLGPYEIVAPIGAGGMGEVYRARDTRLERTVAIKILAADVTDSPERKQRFEREARAISSLQHPHICVLYDVGNHDGLDYLVMEYLEGESLADRLHKGPLPTNQLLKMGIEIADALDKAHRQGLVHRDLKPGNVMLTKGGAKLLDFGLAKACGFAAAAGGSSEAIPTLTSAAHPVTARGAIVGTFQYMSPEQIQGKEADARSDLFALGALLYEAATGTQAFQGKTQISVMSAILERQPEPVTSLNAASPPALDYVIRTCLEKEPDDRFQTAHDVSLQLKWISGSSATALSLPGLARRRRWWPLAGWAVAAAVLVVIAAWLLLRPTPASPVVRLALPLPGRQSLPIDVAGAVAVSPDGAKFAYIAAESGKTQLYLRPIDRFEPLIIPDSEGAVLPFFSVGSDWVYFFAHGHLRKAATNGSAVPVNVADLPTFYGGAALPDGSVLVATSDPPLGIVPPQGGMVKPVALPANRVDPGAPIVLPGGEWTLFTDDKVNRISVIAMNLTTRELRMLVPNAAQPGYVPGYLLYDSAGTIYAAPFDSKAVRITGTATAVAQDVASRNFYAHYSASPQTLVFAPGAGTSAARNLFWVDRAGKGSRLDVPPEDYVDPNISADGKHFVVCIRNLNEQSLAVYDAGRALLMRMSANSMRNVAPIWSADGKMLYFDATGQGARHGVYRMPADGSAAPVLVRELTANAHLTSVAGNSASVTVSTTETGLDLWTLALDGGEMKPFRTTKANERQGSYSPDGKFLAYASDESGDSEVYVESVSGSGARWQVSTSGGDQPRWSRNSNEIFYRNGTRMMSVAVQTSPFAAGKAVQLFDVDYDRGGAVPGYDVSPDGQRFLMTVSEHPNPTEIRVVVGWPGLLRQKAPAAP